MSLSEVSCLLIPAVSRRRVIIRPVASRWERSDLQPQAEIQG